MMTRNHLVLGLFGLFAACDEAPTSSAIAVAPTVEQPAAMAKAAPLPTCIEPGETFFRGTYEGRNAVLPERQIRVRIQGDKQWLVHSVKGTGRGSEFTCGPDGLKVTGHEVAFVDHDTLMWDGQEYRRVKGRFDADDYAQKGCPPVGSIWRAASPTGSLISGARTHAHVTFKETHASYSDEDWSQSKKWSCEGGLFTFEGRTAKFEDGVLWLGGRRFEPAK